ncbi:MAG: anti-sigma factor, partial [Nocardioidaceae bacterium]
MSSEIHDQAALYVVGALTEPEAAEFETHLDDCPECTAEVAELSETTLELSQATAAAPPEGLRSAIMAEVANTPQVTARAETAPQATVHDIASHKPTSPSATEGHGAPPASWLSKLPHLVAAAAVLLALVAGAWAFQSHNDAQQAQDRTQRLTKLLGSGDVQVASGKVAGGGAATVVMSPDSGAAMFMGQDLPQLPSGKVYELWTITDTPAP